MAKIRVFVFLSTILVVGLVSLFVSYYARGYRLDWDALLQGSVQFEPNGILAIKSEPNGASIFINGDLETATDANLSLPPGSYDVEVRREGYFTWSKKLIIEKEIVTAAYVSLFKNVPSLSPVTFSGAKNPIVSENGTKIAYVVPLTKEGTDRSGLWTLDVVNLPLGFSNDPRRITDGDLDNASYIFSPDERQILLTTVNGTFLLDTGSFTPQAQLINVAARQAAILEEWKKERNIKDESMMRGLAPALVDVLTDKSEAFIFSPDSSMIAYTASEAATLKEGLIKGLPGSSTQKEERELGKGRTYVYDIKEDRNFLISETPVTLTNPEGKVIPALRWLTSSRHLLLAEDGKITIMDYDGTNRQTVYSGSYVPPYAFPYSNSTRLLILTNLGATNSVGNMYALTVK
jgi:hypothetical protein